MVGLGVVGIRLYNSGVMEYCTSAFIPNQKDPVFLERMTGAKLVGA